MSPDGRQWHRCKMRPATPVRRRSLRPRCCVRRIATRDGGRRRTRVQRERRGVVVRQPDAGVSVGRRQPGPTAGLGAHQRSRRGAAPIDLGDLPTRASAVVARRPAARRDVLAPARRRRPAPWSLTNPTPASWETLLRSSESLSSIHRRETCVKSARRISTFTTMTGRPDGQAFAAEAVEGSGTNNYWTASSTSCVRTMCDAVDLEAAAADRRGRVGLPTPVGGRHSRHHERRGRHRGRCLRRAGGGRCGEKRDAESRGIRAIGRVARGRSAPGRRVRGWRCCDRHDWIDRRSALRPLVRTTAGELRFLSEPCRQRGRHRGVLSEGA